MVATFHALTNPPGSVPATTDRSHSRYDTITTRAILHLGCLVMLATHHDRSRHSMLGIVGSPIPTLKREPAASPLDHPSYT
jgi:hypothetical protein